jgi:hypothetical protein
LQFAVRGSVCSSRFPSISAKDLLPQAFDHSEQVVVDPDQPLRFGLPAVTESVGQIQQRHCFGGFTLRDVEDPRLVRFGDPLRSLRDFRAN